MALTPQGGDVFAPHGKRMSFMQCYSPPNSLPKEEIFGSQNMSLKAPIQGYLQFEGVGGSEGAAGGQSFALFSFLGGANPDMASTRRHYLRFR